MAASATVGILRVLLSANTAEFESAMASAGQSMKGLQKDFGTIGQQAIAAGSLLTGAFTVPLAAIGVGATKAAMDFETAFADVAKTVDGVAESTGKLTPKGEALALVFRDMAKEIPVTTTELSKIAALGGQMGVPIDQLEKFTFNVAALSVAVDGISAETAASGLAAIGNAAGVGTSQVAEMASTLSHLGNNSNATEGAILELTQRLIGAGTTVGMTIPQVMTLATTMANVGIEAEKGGTAMSTVIQKIGVAVSTNSEKLQEFAAVAGQSAQQFAETWKRSPVEAIQLVIEGLGRMKENGTDLNLTMIDLGLKGTRVSDVMKLVAGNTGDVANTLAIANEGWQDGGKHIEEFNKKASTTANELKVLWNQITDLGITLGGVFLPLIKQAVSVVEFFIPVIKAAVDAFAAMPAPVQLVVVAVGGLLAAIGPVLVAFGLMVTAITPLLPLFAALVPTIAAVGAVLASLALPIAAVIAAIGLLTAAWIKWGDDIKRIVSETFAAVKNWLVDQWEGSIFQAVARMLMAMSELYVALQVRVAAEVAKIFNAVKEWLLDKLRPVFEAVKPLVDGVVKVWTVAKDAVITVVTALYTGVKTWLVDKFSAIVDAVKAKIDAVTGFFKDMKDKVVGHSYVVEMVDGIAVQIERLDSVMVQPVQQFTDDVKQMFSGMRNDVNSLIDRLVSDADTSFTRMRTQTGITLQGLGQSFSQMFSQGIPGIFQSFTQGPLGQLISQMGTALGGTTQRILGTFQGIMRDGFALASGIARAFAGDFSGIIDGIMAGIRLVQAAWSALSGLFSGGEEGTQVNPARDSFLAQFGPRGTGEGSGFWNLGLALEGAVGFAQAQLLHQALQAADTMSEFAAAVAAINNALHGGGGGFVNPGSFSVEAPEEVPGIHEMMTMANGGSGTVHRPTLFLAGEDGAEHYNFTPANQSGGGMAKDVHVHFHGPVLAEEEYIQTTVVDNVLSAIRGNRNSAFTRAHAALGTT